MRIIKSYEILVEQCRKNELQLPYDDDLAVTRFRSFNAEAHLMIQRAKDPYARAVMREVLETLLADLADK